MYIHRSKEVCRYAEPCYIGGCGEIDEGEEGMGNRKDGVSLCVCTYIIVLKLSTHMEAKDVKRAHHMYVNKEHLTLDGRHST